MKSHAGQSRDEHLELTHAIEHAAHVLPGQGPIEVFIHHNTLHAYQALPFHDAIARAEDDLGVTGYLEEEEYRACLRRGRISAEDLEWALARAETRLGSPALPKALKTELRDFLRALLLRAPGPMSRDTFELLKSEGLFVTALAPDLPPEAKTRIVEETMVWLRGALEDAKRTGDLFPFARRAVGPRVDVVYQRLEARSGSEGREGARTAESTSRSAARSVPSSETEPRAGAASRAKTAAIRQVLAPLHVAPHVAAIEAALARDPSAFAASCLWGVAVELSGGADVLAPAPGDPVLDEANALVNEVLIPLCASYTDRGVARWTLAERQDGFFATWRALYAHGAHPLPAWLAGLDEELARSAAAREDALEVLLREVKRLSSSSERWSALIEDVLLRLPGWAGMFHRLERFPVSDLPFVRLVDYLAVRLILERFARSAAARRLDGFERFRPTLLQPEVLALYAAAEWLGLSAPALDGLSELERRALIEVTARFDGRARRRTWQEAYERHHAVEVLGALEIRSAAPVRAPARPKIQAAFCIDDREESFRRHFEEVWPEVETLGAAGFFGVAMEFLPLDDVEAAPHAPLGVVPAHQIVELPHPEDEGLARRRREMRGAWGWLGARWQDVTRGVASGGLASLLAGPPAIVGVGLRVAAPRTTEALVRRARRVFFPEPRTILTEPRITDQDRTIDGRFLGFTYEEKAQRVAATLENLGIAHNLAPLVFIVAHGSSSLNNPHRSAYDCGACGGRNGGPNARLFARMANRPEVRSALAARGITIPSTTHFVGAVHDTCTDEVSFYDVEALPEALAGLFEEAKAAFQEVSRRSAHERCRRLASAPRAPSLSAALEHVRGRAADLSQARPELGHATNAVCVIGRRQLTRGLFLDRRAFLVSYDPTQDPTGTILERIVAAAGPVGAGINLEYYFSRVDNERLGAGTKLPHNVVAHLGVMNGALSDLRTGLPKQMIEIHEPVRLLLVLETENEVVSQIVERQPVIRELAVNEWVRVATISPSGRGISLFLDGAFVPFEGGPPELPRVAASRDWYLGHEDFLPPALIAPGEAARRTS